jgi:transposase
MGPDPGGPARPRHGCPDPRLDRRPRPPLRRRRQKKWDGSGGQAEQALGRIRGGFGTKIHASCDGLGHPVELILTAAQESDIAQAEALLADHAPEAVIADKGYDKKALAEEVQRRGAEAVIPTQKGRNEPRAIDRHLYRERNLVERLWSKLKQYRRVATRYEKKGANFLAFVKVAAMMVMLK